MSSHHLRSFVLFAGREGSLSTKIACSGRNGFRKNDGPIMRRALLKIPVQVDIVLIHYYILTIRAQTAASR